MSRRALVLGATAAIIVAAGAGAWVAWGGESSAGSASTGSVATTLASVVRRDLAETESFTGTLGFSDGRTLTAQAQGTITALAPEGTIRKRGEALYRVDERPVVLMYGAVPAWRSLSSGVDDGRDVAQLERNLVRLGHDPDRDVTIDNHFDWATAAAVNRWLDGLGLSQTGRVDLGAVAFMPGPRRIGQHAAAVGTSLQPGASVTTISATSQKVTVDLEATRQTLAVKGRRVSVTLPDGSSVPGRISAVGAVAEVPETSASGETSSPTESATIQVDIQLLKAPRNALDQAPVDVELTTESRRNVLAVPVTALVALLGGGYAVEVRSDDATRLVAVKPGLYAEGYVEVAGSLREGDRVVVPQ